MWALELWLAVHAAPWGDGLKRRRFASWVLENPYWERGCAVALYALVTVLALLPRPPEALGTGWDKLNHLLAFATLPFVILLRAAGKPAAGETAHAAMD